MPANCAPACAAYVLSTLRVELNGKTFSYYSAKGFNVYEPTTIALTIPPRTPGIPCKLWMPHVSSSPKKLFNLGPILAKPKVEIAPIKNPIVRLAVELVIKPAEAPIQTPPASVAFRISSISNFYLKNEEMTNALKQLPVSAHIVLVTIRALSTGVVGKYPALKEGQYIHKKKVPKTAIEFEKEEDVGPFSTF